MTSVDLENEHVDNENENELLWIKHQQFYYVTNNISTIAANMLQQLCQFNAINCHTQQKTNLTIFHCVKPPSIHISNYIKRLCYYSECSSAAIIAALYNIVYTIRFEIPELEINDYTVHRLFLASLLVSSKFHDDKPFSNKIFASIGGVTCKELNYMEVEILDLIQFNLHILPNRLDEIIQDLCNFEHQYQMKLNEMLNLHSAISMRTS